MNRKTIQTRNRIRAQYSEEILREMFTSRTLDAVFERVGRHEVTDEHRRKMTKPAVWLGYEILLGIDKGEEEPAEDEGEEASVV